MATVGRYVLVKKDGSEWKVANSAQTAVATKEGREYRLKQYCKYPNKEASGSMWEEDVRGYEQVLKRVSTVHDQLKKVDPERKHLAYADEVMDLRTGLMNGVIEAVPTVEHGQPLTAFKSSTPNERRALALSIVEGVKLVHKAGIRHGDLKLENILFIRQSRLFALMNTYKAIIIDFDHSYPKEEVPHSDVLGGTNGYVPYEAYEYTEFCEEHYDDLSCLPPDLQKELDTLKRRISLHSDIFALGVVLYGVLAGKSIYDNRGEVIFDRAALNPYPAAFELITAMLDRDPYARPDIETVERILDKGTAALEELGNRNPPAAPRTLSVQLWPEHALDYHLNPNIVGVDAIDLWERDGIHGYRVIRNGISRFFPIDMMDKRHYVLPGMREYVDDDEYDRPFEMWERHAGYQFDWDRLAENGYTRVQRCESEAGNGSITEEYKLICEDRTFEIKSFETLLRQRFIISA